LGIKNKIYHIFLWKLQGENVTNTGQLIEISIMCLEPSAETLAKISKEVIEIPEDVITYHATVGLHKPYLLPSPQAQNAISDSSSLISVIFPHFAMILLLMSGHVRLVPVAAAFGDMSVARVPVSRKVDKLAFDQVSCKRRVSLLCFIAHI